MSRGGEETQRKKGRGKQEIMDSQGPIRKRGEKGESETMRRR